MHLTDRDRAVLRLVERYRYVTSDHIHGLVFGAASRTVSARRLRLLWANHFVDRQYIPVVLDQVGVRQSCRPVYALAQEGAKVLAPILGVSPSSIPHTPGANRRGHQFLVHHLVAVDFLAALEVTCRERSDIQLVEARPERVLRRELRRARAAGYRGEAVVSDGAVNLHYPNLGKTMAYQLEVVRADVRGGNRRLVDKLRKYAALHRQGFFERVHGMPHTRAVLIATTSQRRADNLRALAGELPHARRLFYFTSYGEEGDVGVPRTSFTPSAILERRWIDADGEPRSLLEP